MSEGLDKVFWLAIMIVAQYVGQKPVIMAIALGLFLVLSNSYGGGKKMKKIIVRVGQGLYLGGVFLFCQFCGLVFAPQKFFKGGPIN